MTVTDIKAIETSYKGYRFRSRLEARWAVYLDALGVKWTYEQEGFELGGGLRYLPDFHLPDSDEYVEIKAGNVQLPRIPSVYMAGKMGHDFRRGIGRQEGDVNWDAPKALFMRSGRQFTNFGNIMAEYYGPFAFDVRTKNHIIAHGSEAGFEDDDLRKSVVDHCLRGIKNADAVVCFIDCNTAYGTMVELGYAAALKKPVFIYRVITDDNYEDIIDATWFAAIASGAHVVNHDYSPLNAEDAAVYDFYNAAEAWLKDISCFNEFNVSQEARKAAAMLSAGKKINVFCGDPMEHTRWISGFNVTELRFAMANDAIEEMGGTNAAAKAARAARFEHGEQGNV